MPNYQSDRFPRKPFTKGPNRFGAPTQKFKADCSKCGSLCEVPFRPNGKKPIFCSNCFVRDDGDAPRPRRDFAPRESFDRPREQREDRSMSDLKQELQAINDKLSRLISIIEVSRAVSKAIGEAPRAVEPKKRVTKKT